MSFNLAHFSEPLFCSSHLFDSLGDDFTNAEFDELTREAGKGNGSFEFNKMYDYVTNWINFLSHSKLHFYDACEQFPNKEEMIRLNRPGIDFIDAWFSWFLLHWIDHIIRQLTVDTRSSDQVGTKASEWAFDWVKTRIMPGHLVSITPAK